MRLEFKKAMDEYEDFIDSYVAYMKKVSAASFDPSMMVEYFKMMSRYAEVMAALDDWENSDMNDVELRYYLGVTDRINKKLMELAR